MEEQDLKKEMLQEEMAEQTATETAEETKEETMEDYSKELEASFRRVREGDILTGTVIAVNEEEAILDLDYYAQGIIKVGEMSSNPKFSILEEIKVGDTIKATVIKVDDGAGNILMSCKEAADMLAWDILKQYRDEEKEISVKVTEAVNGGVIAYVEGIRGFIPASQISLTYVEKTEEWVNKELFVRVLTVEEDKKKLVLSAKAVEKIKEADKINHKISMMVPGSIMEGTVESLMPYGAFISLPDGMSGLVHISQICQKRIKKPSEVLSVGDKVKVKMLNTNNNKISLSIKAVEEDAGTDENIGKEAREYSSGEQMTTSLGDLFAKLKL